MKQMYGSNFIGGILCGEDKQIPNQRMRCNARREIDILESIFFDDILKLKIHNTNTKSNHSNPSFMFKGIKSYWTMGVSLHRRYLFIL